LRAGREIALLAGIDDRVRRRLMAESFTRKLKPRTIIFAEGTPAAHLHILMSGAVELFGTSGGREAVIALLEPGDSFIMAAVVKDAVTLMSARTIEESQVLYVPAATFRQAMHVDPVLAVKVAMELGTGFRSMVKNLRDHKLRSAKQRLAAYLVRLARARKGEVEIELPVTKRVLSSLLGVEPESLSRVFLELRTIGVEMKRDQVYIADMAELEKLANSDWVIDNPRS